VNAIARFEQLCARVVEGTFARIFPSALEPVHVGRKLIAAQNATPTDTYLVRVHPVDYVRFAADREFLIPRWSRARCGSKRSWTIVRRSRTARRC
jgi:hypothetical protein